MQEVFSTLSCAIQCSLRQRLNPQYFWIISSGFQQEVVTPRAIWGNVHRPQLEQWWWEQYCQWAGNEKANILQSEGCSSPRGTITSHLPLTPALRKLLTLCHSSHFLSEPYKVDESCPQHFPWCSLLSSALGWGLLCISLGSSRTKDCLLEPLPPTCKVLYSQNCDSKSRAKAEIREKSFSFPKGDTHKMRTRSTGLQRPFSTRQQTASQANDIIPCNNRCSILSTMESK